MVSYDGKLWYSTEETEGEEPSDDSTVWVNVPISIQTAVGTEIPDNLESGGLWMHMQDDGHVQIKTQNSDGTYSVLYPETYASYVKDASGKSMQKWICQHYFEREDVKVMFTDKDPVFTRTATLLSNENIVVAKHVITDNLIVGGQRIHEFTAYDDTGVYIMYQTKMIETWTDNYTSYLVPEVIV